jgi:hypothetical protein
MQSWNSSGLPSLALTGVLLLASTGVRAGSLHVTAADALGNQAYDLNFGTATATPLITPLPANPVSSVRSIVYVSNEQTAKADLWAADNRANQIVRYAGASGSPLVVWAADTVPAVPGPMSPIGMSADSFGNIFVGRGDYGSPELWMFKHNSDGSYSPPILVDKAGFGTSNQTRIVDTVVVGTSIVNGPVVGDVLVLVNDGRLLRYSAALIKDVSAAQPYNGLPTTLIPAGIFNQGHIVTSVALWPTDGSALIPTVDGAVRRYKLTTTGSTPMSNFATGLASEATGIGQLLGLIKTYVDASVSPSVPYVVLDNPQRNQILQLAAPTGNCDDLTAVCNKPVATITSVSNPVGLAVTDAATSNQDCVDNSPNPTGCVLLNGSLKVATSSAQAGGSVIVVSCTVEDTRFDSSGAFTGGTLLVSSVCPGYPETLVPAYLSGASGASGHAMTFFKFEEVGGYSVAPADLLVNGEFSAEAIAGAGSGIPLCPQLAVGWAPLATEGVIVEGNTLMEPTTHCGSTKILSPGHSLTLIGAQITPGTNLLTLANTKFSALNQTIINAMNFKSSAVPDKTTLGNYVSHANTLLSAGSLTAANQADCAAHQLLMTDNLVTAALFNDNTSSLSTLSEIKGRLENLFMHIEARITQHTYAVAPPTYWPQNDPLPTTALNVCDIGAPTTPGTITATYPSKNTKTVNLSWGFSTDTPANGATVSNAPGPYASGVHGYHVYLNGIEQPGSPTTNNMLQISLSPSVKSNTVKVTAFDNATPNPNVSAAAMLVLN